jgi:hypothetical protein
MGGKINFRNRKEDKVEKGTESVAGLALSAKIKY